MSIRIAGDMAKMACREAMEEAAKLADRVGDEIMREAKRHHDNEDDPDHYDRYEECESRASVAYHVAGRIRRRSRRTPRR